MLVQLLIITFSESLKRRLVFFHIALQPLFVKIHHNKKMQISNRFTIMKAQYQPLDLLLIRLIEHND